MLKMQDLEKVKLKGFIFIVKSNKSNIMKKTFILMALGIASVSFAFSQSFSPSGLKPGESKTNPNRAVTATYVITHSVSQTITSSSSVSCNAGGLHTDNSYMRVFDLVNDFSISGPISVTSVDFGIELADGATGSQPVTVNIYTLSGSLLFSNLTLIASQPISVPDQSLTILNVPISASIPAGSLLVVEIYTPDGQISGNSFFVGSNGLGQTGPTYLAAADCGVPQPTNTALIGFPNMHFVLNVNAEPGGTVPISSWPIIISLVVMSAFILYRVKS
jgi:hypothetical protein